jgi:hypothetical protein
VKFQAHFCPIAALPEFFTKKIDKNLSFLIPSKIYVEKLPFLFYLLYCVVAIDNSFCRVEVGRMDMSRYLKNLGSHQPYAWK